MGNWVNLLPVFCFLMFMLGVSFYIQYASRKERSTNFARDYFIGGYSLGGFVLAMTTVATYSSVSTFVGGPGMAWLAVYGHCAGCCCIFGFGCFRQKNCAYFA